MSCRTKEWCLLHFCIVSVRVLNRYEKRIVNMFERKDIIIETERLYLREMNQGDFHSLCRILQDNDTMYAYEGAFSDAEVQEWLDRQISRYQKWDFGLWAVILKETNEMIGQCGLTMQPWKDGEVLEIGYLFDRRYWHKGYATEAARACKQYAFEILKADEVCSIIRDTNIASQKVAIRNGMAVKDSWVKHYRGVDMPHDRYVAIRSLSEKMKTHGIDLVLFIGQSNMAGRGIVSTQWPQEAPKLIDGAAWEYRAISAPNRLMPLEEPFGVDENTADGINDVFADREKAKTGSLVTAFCNAYYEETGRVIVGVSASKGGSTITEWLPDDPLRTGYFKGTYI